MGSIAAAALSFSACSIGMTLLNKLAVSRTSAPLGVLVVQLATTCVLAIASGNLHFGTGTRRWAMTIPFLFVAMMVSSMLALKYVSVGTFVVVRNLSPLFTLAAEVFLHRPSSLRFDVPTVGPLLAILFGVLLYEHSHSRTLSFSPVGLGLLLVNIVFACLERLGQRHLLAVDTVDVSKPGLMILNNGIGLLIIAVGVAVVDSEEYARTWNALSRPADAALVLGSSVVGCGISYTAIWLQVCASTQRLSRIAAHEHTNLRSPLPTAHFVLVLRRLRSQPRASW